MVRFKVVSCSVNGGKTMKPTLMLAILAFMCTSIPNAFAHSETVDSRIDRLIVILVVGSNDNLKYEVPCKEMRDSSRLTDAFYNGFSGFFRQGNFANSCITRLERNLSGNYHKMLQKFQN